MEPGPSGVGPRKYTAAEAFALLCENDSDERDFDADHSSEDLSSEESEHESNDDSPWHFAVLYVK